MLSKQCIIALRKTKVQLVEISIFYSEKRVRVVVKDKTGKTFEDSQNYTWDGEVGIDAALTNACQTIIFEVEH